MTRSTTVTLSALLLLATTAACAPSVATRGNIVDPDRLAQIKAGATRAEDVVGILGTPSQVGTFDNRTWYYIGMTMEKVAFFEPEIVDQRVVVINFDDTGLVKDVKSLDRASAQEVEMVERATPSSGRELTFLEQLMGNVGRFNRPNQGGRSTGSVLRGPDRM